MRVTSLRKFAKLGRLLVGILILSLFQNCSKEYQFANDHLSLNEVSGNGSHYDGKPDVGTYYRTIPNFRCGKDFSLYGKIEVRETNVKANLINSETCAFSEQILNRTDLDFNAFEREIVGYDHAVFAKNETAPDLTRHDLPFVEAWCRSVMNTVDSGEAIVVILAPETNTGIARLSAGGYDSQNRWISQQSNFTISNRQVEDGIIRYSGDSIQVSVDYKTQDSEGRVSGHFNIQYPNGSYDKEVKCHLGGVLDSQAQPAPFQCPAGYALLPPMEGYTSSRICVAKYEAKQDGILAVSNAMATPWANVTQVAALTACRENGPSYDLIANAEWQAIARNIESVGVNWSTGQPGVGLLSQGHTDRAPNNALTASADDTQACFGTGQTCDLTFWNGQRRVQQLTNGELIWDLSGNLWEWTKDHHNVPLGVDVDISALTDIFPFANAKTLYGPAGDYSSLSYPFGNLGHLWNRTSQDLILRGGSWTYQAGGGLFSVQLDANNTIVDPEFGFRCTYHP